MFAQQRLGQIEACEFQVWRVTGSNHGLQFLDTGGAVVGQQQADREIESRFGGLRLASRGGTKPGDSSGIVLIPVLFDRGSKLGRDFHVGGGSLVRRRLDPSE